ncbi:excinuclease ABC subunit A [Candidatus Poribacteria bacterium]|nr:excinuclease ABC subunit A [Candidatus Poribacteria bacterium]
MSQDAKSELAESASTDFIEIRGAGEHNLRNVDLCLPKNQLIVFTGVSGSGKSSLAFDTIYAEGQRRYIESLSSYARQFLGQIEKPRVDSIAGLSPAISIDQKTVSNNPRSTVATITGIYDYLRVLYTNVGKLHCLECRQPLGAQTADQIINQILTLPDKTRFLILAPIVRSRRGRHKRELDDALRLGYARARIDGQIVQLVDDIPLDTRQRHNIEIVIDRLIQKPGIRPRLADAVETALRMGEGNLILSVVADSDQAEYTEDQFFSRNLTCGSCQINFETPTPSDFSFNSPSGMCPACRGLGTVEMVMPDRVVPDESLSIADGAVLPWGKLEDRQALFIAHSLTDHYQFSLEQPWCELDSLHQRVVLEGTQGDQIPMIYRWYRNRRHKRRRAYDGVLAELMIEFAYAQEIQDTKWLKSAKHYLAPQICPECNGKRIKKSVQAVTIQNQSIIDLTEMTIDDCLQFFESLALPKRDRLIARELLKEIRGRLKLLTNVGLGYLSLNRMAPTLSGGESQRIRLASQIGAGLQNVIYVLDEPSIGLHTRDNKHLLTTLKHLRNQGNTVIVVEHDEDTMWSADLLVDFGPGAGINGGQVVSVGPPCEVAEKADSLTAKYLRKELEISIPKVRRTAKLTDQGDPLYLEIRGAKHNNLKNVDVQIPVGVFICITGVSGSGKSSLINDILHKALDRDLMRAGTIPGEYREIRALAGNQVVDDLRQVIDKVIAIDQSPIGRIPRSNPATYTKLFDQIRNFYTELPESKVRGYKPGRFSFNVKGGRCEACEGNGANKIEMQLLADVWVTCNVCSGSRYNQETLSVKYKGKSIADILNMDVQEALSHFSAIPKVAKILQTLQDVGMEYMKVGQPSPTLSGGEAQRIKLARELSKRSTGKTLYVLDEPTTGLHFDDVKKLLRSLHRFVNSGNTVVVIEHNLEVIKTADYIVDLGPEGGEAGGQIIAVGTPETAAQIETSYTGQALKVVLSNKEIKSIPSQSVAIEQVRQPQVGAFDGSSEPRARPGELSPLPTRLQTTKPSAISVFGASEHNLKGLTVEIPHGKLTAFTGVSGSGKSSLALDTIYAEGQRRYIGSLSAYARQFLGQMEKPQVDRIEGLSPAIALERKGQNKNPRSTVGTITEIYDYLRVLYARIGQAHCPNCGQSVQAQTEQQIITEVLNLPDRSRIYVLSPLDLQVDYDDEPLAEILQHLVREGYARVEVNKRIYPLDQVPTHLIPKPYSLNLVIDRLLISQDNLEKGRLAEAIEVALAKSERMVVIRIEPNQAENKIKPIYQAFTTQFACVPCDEIFPELTPQHFSFNSQIGRCSTCQGLGTLGRDPTSCPDCQGTRLQPFPRRVTIPALDWRLSESVSSTQPLVGLNGDEDRGNELTLAEITALSISDTAQFFQQIDLSDYQLTVGQELLNEIQNRLQFLVDIGLHYLTLNNIAPTLSGGEFQRIQLANQLGSGLTGVTYILDEPTIGLHQRDNQRLVEALKKLRDLGNSVLVIEHDACTISESDHLLDFGPGAGQFGGQIVAQGTPNEVRANPASLTGQYLSRTLLVDTPTKQRLVHAGMGVDQTQTCLRPNLWLAQSGISQIEILGASTHNLKNIDVTIPVGMITCVTGVSGCGKSSLVEHTLFPIVSANLNRATIPATTRARGIRGLEHTNTVINVDQNPIGESPRSNLATYTDLFTKIRGLFAAQDASQKRGYNALRFSFNMAIGQCEACQGLGYNRIEMYFLTDVWVKCDTCDGTGYNRETLEIRYRGKNIAEILQMTVASAADFFQDQTNIRRPLQMLKDVGLEYMQLGQPGTTLSGGEAQRIKLASELSRRGRGRTLYLMDEPTTGLHAADVHKLMKVINRLVDQDNTVVIIEHNLDVIKCADWVIDLGPEGGHEGGELIACGTPEQVAEVEASHTGRFLKQILAN